MKVAERHKKILGLVKGHHHAVEELAAELEVSPVTIRRDLARLAQQGLVTRTLGGAAAIADTTERSLQQRAAFAQDEKRKIAEAAVEMIAPGQMVYLDSGTTAGALAEAIAAHASNLPGLTVVTASLSVAAKLCEVAPIKLILLGGELRRLSQGMMGPLAERTLESLTFDIAFLSGDALSAEYGIGEAEPGQTRLKDQVMRRSTVTIALADANKLTRSDAHHWAAMPRGATVITDLDGARAAPAFEQKGYALIAV